MTGCPDDNQLQRLIEGHLVEVEARALHGHIDQCSGCRGLLLELARPEGSGPAPAAQDAEPPQRFEEYRLLRSLGRGAMGQVYLGHDTQLDRLVAIKFLAALRPDTAARERFLVEARAIARLQHPGVVAIYRIGEVAGRPYLVSEFIPGQGLETLPRPVPWQRALAIGLGLARGLCAAHRRGVLHRDIKPANVILTESGEVKLLDFGLAKLMEAQEERAREAAGEKGPAGLALGDTLPPPGGGESLGGVVGAASPSLTGTGAVLGTPLYMAPEIWRGARATPATDVYSVGALLYELCTGRAPFTGLTLHELRRAVLDREVAPLASALSAGAGPIVDGGRFAAVVERCLRRDPAARYASGEELALALEEVQAGETRRAAAQEQAGAARPRRGAWIVAAAALCLAGAVLSLSFQLRAPRTPAAAAPPRVSVVPASPTPVATGAPPAAAPPAAAPPARSPAHPAGPVRPPAIRAPHPPRQQEPPRADAPSPAPAPIEQGKDDGEDFIVR